MDSTTTTTTTTTTSTMNKKKRSLEEEVPTIMDGDEDNNKDNDGVVDNGQDDDDDDAAHINRAKKRMQMTRRDCPYLDTVNRSVLDFDFEKICSISFVNLNVYACLVCGRFFQGKSEGSHAHYHCLQANHHVFVNLHNQKIYCLPDDYQVIDPSLDDIKYLINPTFTSDQITKLDMSTKYSRSLDGTQYLPGYVGLNNIKKNSFINVVIQSLARVSMVRDYFIDQDNIKSIKSPLVLNFGELLRKIWNNRNFKGHVSPHELVQAIQSASKRKFTIGAESDPLELLQWFLNMLSADLRQQLHLAKQQDSIIQKAFSGEVYVTTKTPLKGETISADRTNMEYSTVSSKVPFMTLVLDLPPKAVFKDEQDKSIIPQVPLFTLLQKYDGRTEKVQPNGEVKIYELRRLPRYLVMCVKRFHHNNFFKEKDPTIVNFPLKGLDLKDYLSPEVLSTYRSTKYNLLSNIRHEGDPNGGSYSVYIYNKGQDKWFEMQDLSVKEVLPQLVAVSEAYILIYE
ncbi:hypothetical protein SAMD00019534_011910, partial [Acytostelium subglobosum LB1]|uniref:hypothetical protein n=1 Tax=Acytostelium subglobosum LB1 TaxID=1410327 RepID=UPI00064494E0